VSRPLSVWHVSREYAGVAEAGGVKDVVRGLAEASVRAGMPATVVLPAYGFFSHEHRSGDPLASFTLSVPDHDRGSAFFDEPVQVREVHLHGVRLLLVDSPRYAALRDVYTYTAEDEGENHWRKKGTGHWDAHQLNLILQLAALQIAHALGESPSVVHCHDGHTAFLPAIMREEPRHARRFQETDAMVTIHNAGKGYHQEVWDPAFASLLTGLAPEVVGRGILNGAVDPLLLSGFYARLVTVSEQYASELLAGSGEELSGGLGGALRGKGIGLSGITNGIDPEPWDPRQPARSGIPAGFDPQSGDLEGKRECRLQLARRLGVPGLPAGVPLYAFVGRLTGQKGIDVLFQAMKRLLAAGPQRWFVVLGTGQKEMEAMLQWLAAQPASGGRLTFLPRFDRALASLIYAASDFFLVPSAYEPCGLTDFIAQIMGSIPIVHRVGGLVKVRDAETGFSYGAQEPGELAAAIVRTTRLFAEEPAVLDRIRRTAFAEIFQHHTWDRVLADAYLPLYESLAAERPWTRK
jgi:starch synthase